MNNDIVGVIVSRAAADISFVKYAPVDGTVNGAARPMLGQLRIRGKAGLLANHAPGAIALPYAETPITAKAWQFLQSDDIFLSYVVNGTMQFVESEHRMEAACQDAAQGLELDGSRPMTPEELSDRSKRRPMDAKVVYGDLV